MTDVSSIKRIESSVFVCEYSLEGYLEAMEGMGRKPRSIGNMRRGCARCLGILESVSPGIRPDMVGVEEVYAIRSGLAGLKESTARGYLGAFGDWIEWQTGANPVKRSRLMWNDAEAERVWITRDEYRRLYRLAAPRERAILALGATMGLRRTEIAGLSLADVEDGSVEIRGKGHGPEGKPARRPITEAVEDALGEWIPERERVVRRYGSGTDRVLVSRRGAPLDPSTVNRSLSALGERAGIDVTPHSLRRLYAMTLADAGIPLETISRMMRHRNVATTVQCYLREDPRRMSEAARAVDGLLGVYNLYRDKV